MRRVLEELYSRIITFDPGLVRLEKACLAMLSFISAWIIMREVLQIFANQLPVPVRLQLVIFAPILSLICSLLITDIRPAERRNTLFLAIFPVAAILIFLTLLPVIPWLYGLILLVLFFFSYYFRRYGARSMELALLATITFYFAALAKITFEVLPWFLLAAITGIFSVFLWRFIIWPYNPARLLHRTNVSYYLQSSILVGVVIRMLQEKPPPANWMKILDSRLKQIFHCRKVIESHLGALSPPVWTQARLERIRIDFYNAEQGINLMVNSLSALVPEYDRIPDDVCQALMKSLIDFQQVLKKIATPQSLKKLESQIIPLRKSVNKLVIDSPDAHWALPLLRFLTGGSQLNQAVKDARDIESDRGILIPYGATRPSRPLTAQIKNQADISTKSHEPRGLRKINLKHFHLTTILGIQASLAALLAMLIAYFLSLDHSNWVFWTAFVVIAGSTGESLRRMSFRVGGTVAGVVAGIVISVILINLSSGSSITIALVAACLFLAAYFIDTSYIWMILWINIAVTLLFVGLGGTIADILIVRPINTLIGASLAALVVIFLLPIRTRERFVRSLAVFLNALDTYMVSYVERLTGKSPTTSLDTAGIRINTTFAQLEQTFPSLALEYNPLARAQNPLLETSTTLRALKLELTRMSQDMEIGLVPSFQGEAVGMVNSIQERVHTNINSLINLLNKKTAEEIRLLTDLFARVNQLQLLEQALKSGTEENPVSETRCLIFLARVNQDLYQLASSLKAD